MLCWAGGFLNISTPFIVLEIHPGTHFHSLGGRVTPVNWTYPKDAQDVPVASSKSTSEAKPDFNVGDESSDPQLYRDYFINPYFWIPTVDG